MRKEHHWTAAHFGRSVLYVEGVRRAVRRETADGWYESRELDAEGREGRYLGRAPTVMGLTAMIFSELSRGGEG